MRRWPKLIRRVKMRCREPRRAWLLSVRKLRPVAMSQKRMVLSSPALMSTFPSGETAKRSHPSVVPAKDANFVHGRHFKEADRIVPASGDQDFCVRREDHRADPKLHGFLESTIVFDEEPAGLRRVLG